MSLNVYFGGTFDPIHSGHLALAMAAQKTLQSDIVFIPSADPPHRPPTSANAQHRIKMVELAIANHPGFICDKRELLRADKSYSIDTLTELRAELNETVPIVWLMGMDSFLGLDTWRHWQDLFSLCHFVIAQRPGQDMAEMSAELKQATHLRWVKSAQALNDSPAGNLFLLPMALREESATGIRMNLQNQLPVVELLPKPVAEYIQSHKLYASGL